MSDCMPSLGQLSSHSHQSVDNTAHDSAVALRCGGKCFNVQIISDHNKNDPEKWPSNRNRSRTACPRKNGPPKYNGVVFEILGKHH